MKKFQIFFIIFLVILNFSNFIKCQEEAEVIDEEPDAENPIESEEKVQLDVEDSTDEPENEANPPGEALNPPENEENPPDDEIYPEGDIEEEITPEVLNFDAEEPENIPEAPTPAADDEATFDDESSGTDELPPTPKEADNQGEDEN